MFLRNWRTMTDSHSDHETHLSTSTRPIRSPSITTLPLIQLINIHVFPMHSSLYTTYTTHFHPIHAPGFPSTPPAHHLFLVLYPSLHSTPTSISLSRFIHTHFLHIPTSPPSASAWPPQPLYPLLLMSFIPPPVHCHHFCIPEGPMQTGPISTPIFHPSHILSLTYPSPRPQLHFQPPYPSYPLSCPRYPLLAAHSTHYARFLQ